MGWLNQKSLLLRVFYFGYLLGSAIFIVAVCTHNVFVLFHHKGWLNTLVRYMVLQVPCRAQADDIFMTAFEKEKMSLLREIWDLWPSARYIATVYRVLRTPSVPVVQHAYFLYPSMRSLFLYHRATKSYLIFFIFLRSDEVKSSYWTQRKKKMSVCLWLSMY